MKLKHLAGDRREYFEAPQDVWEIFKSLAEEKRRREVEPTLSMLRAALVETPGSDADAHAQKRMQQMHELIDLSSTWFDDVQRLSPETLARSRVCRFCCERFLATNSSECDLAQIRHQTKNAHGRQYERSQYVDTLYCSPGSRHP